MELEPVGRVENPEDIDLDPIILPVVGYLMADKSEVIERFACRPVIPIGQLGQIFDAQQNGGITVGKVIAFIRSCLIGEDVDRFQAFLARDDLVFDPMTISRTLNVLMEVYDARPTLPHSASTGGGGATKQTSPAASRARASTSRRKRQRSPST